MLKPSPPPTSPHSACKGCAHFFVTYDPAFPYGCRALGFKSRRYPDREVREASGSECLARQDKNRAA